MNTIGQIFDWRKDLLTSICFIQFPFGLIVLSFLVVLHLCKSHNNALVEIGT